MDDVLDAAVIAISGLTVVGLVGLLIYEAVAGDRADYAGVCLDDITYERVDEARCGDFDDEGHDSVDGLSLVWIDVSSATHIPARGERVSASYGIRTVPGGQDAHRQDTCDWWYSQDHHSRWTRNQRCRQGRQRVVVRRQLVRLTIGFAAVIAVTAIAACNDSTPEVPGETKLTGIVDQVDLSSPLCAERTDGRTIKVLVRPDGYDKEGDKLPLRIVCVSRAELNQGGYEKGKRYP